MEHAFVLRYYSSVQMPMKEDEGFPRKLTNTGKLKKFHIGSQQEDHIQESQIDHFFSSDAGGLITGPINDLPEAIQSSKLCAVGNVNVAANLQESADKLIQTADKTKVKQFCYTDIGFSQPLQSEPEFCAGITPVVSSSFGCLPEAYIPDTYRKPFLSYPGNRSEELNARKNKESKVYHDEASKDQINRGHARFQQNGIGPWNHLYRLAASVGSLKAPNENSVNETGHGSQIPSFMGFNFDLPEQVGDKQNEHDHAKMLQNHNEMPDQVKQKSSFPQNLSNGKQPLQHSYAKFNASASHNSYHGASLTTKPVTQPSEGIRTKVLSSSCSYQFFVKDSLNDNRSAAVRQVTVHSDDQLPQTRKLKSGRQFYEQYGEGNCQPPGTSSAHSSKLDLQRSIEMNDVNLSNGFILRLWLSRRSCMVDKIENLHIFKQILELVELAHSQGLVLRNIRPSCFMVSALNRVIFLESSPSQSKIESSKHQGYSSSIVSLSPELNQNKKRPWHHLTMDAAEGQQSNQMLKSSDTGNLRHEHPRLDMVAGFQNRGSSARSSSVNMCTGQDCELFSAGPGIEGNAGGKLLSMNTESPRHERHEGQHQVRERTGGHCQRILGLFDDKELLMLEENWYISPEELNGGTKTFSSDIYGLGVLLFELFCTFTSLDEQISAMSDLRHRILPPRFLSEYPREAGFCLWLLHPDPCSRPRTREIIHSELLNEARDALAERQVAAGLDEEDAETELLTDFLLRLQKQKQERACKLGQDVACLMTDIEEVDKRRSLLLCSSPVANIQSGLAISSKDDIAREMLDTSTNCFEQDGKKSNIDKKSVCQESSTGGVEQDSLNLDANPSRPQSFSSKGARLMKNFKHLEQVYFAMRGKIGPPEIDCTKSSKHGQNIPSNSCSTGVLSSDYSRLRHGEYDNVDRLGCFFDSICKYARYSRFEVRATLRHGDLLNTANVVCSVGFDRDQEFFATAGVSKKIKVFGCDAVLNENVDIYYPAVEMTSKSKLSSICWNSYIKSHLASTDYDGMVQLWDASTGQAFAQYNEHQKRAWSVDFSHADPTKLASGSDDCTVKLWSINQKRSTATIKTVANVCCVQFPPDSGNMIAFGSADYKIYCYDLRNPKIPWCTLASHGKAVSYVKFVDSNTVVSASTDNTLKLWDLTKAKSSGGSNSACTLTFTGHTNEKNFVGLSVAEGYIACGSETNSVFTYYKSLPMPLASHKFGFVDPISGQESEDDSGQFVSSVCWRGKSQILVAANSAGNIKLLEIV